jgi:hypothetical protein
MTNDLIFSLKTDFMRRELIENNPIVKLTLNFALSVIEYCEKLETEKKFVIAKQSSDLEHPL